MNKYDAKILLSDVSGILRNMKMKHFITDGTLLGLIRENDFIEHDNDIDIGVFNEEWSSKTLGEFVRRCIDVGINVEHMFGRFGGPFEIAVKRDGVKCDLFFYHRSGDKRIFHAFEHGGKILERDTITYGYDADICDELIMREFHGEKYPTPRRAEDLLIAKYGDDWMTPKTDWDWAHGPKNILI